MTLAVVLLAATAAQGLGLILALWLLRRGHVYVRSASPHSRATPAAHGRRDDRRTGQYLRT